MNREQHNREEYVEQAYFFRTYRERLDDELPAQDILQAISQEILSTTRLPYAIEFMASEMMIHGRVSGGMQRLSHYFTPFQSFVFEQAELDRSRFDLRVGLEVLEKEAEFLASEQASPQGLFVYQFEAIARNRLGYQEGLGAVSQDPMYDENWRDWIYKVRQSLGAVEFSEMIYARSEYRVREVQRRTGNEEYRPSYAVLFGAHEGRIAKADQGRDPLYMFAALQRHLGYPKVPRPSRAASERIDPLVEQRLQQLETRIKILEAEQAGKLDLSEFYVKPPDEPDFKKMDNP